MIRYNSFKWIFVLLSSLVLLFILAPLAGIFLHTSAPEFFETAKDPEVQQSIWLTLWVSFAATSFSAIGAVPLAWLMARKNFPMKKVVQGVIDLPIVLPHTAAGIALLGFISREGLLGRTAGIIGLNLVNNPAGIAMAMAFVSLPFFINSARDGFAAVPEKLEKAALNLGAGRTRVFFTISVPLSKQSLITGFIMMFARGMSEFGAVVIVAYHPMIAPVLIFERFNSYGLDYSRPAAVIFILVALLVMILLRLLPMRRKITRITEDAET